jgi:hypothetical protein
MVAMTAVGAAWLVIGVCVAIGFAAISVVTALNELRVWRLRRRGLDRCRFCGTLLTTIVHETFRFPVGFMSVCPGCGRDQGPWDEHARLT